jgi:hypothetical protein
MPLPYLMTLWLVSMVDNLLKRMKGMGFREDMADAFGCRY